MKVYADPLLAEAVPDGTFGGARTLRRDRPKNPPRKPDPRAAEHYAELAEAISRRRSPRPEPLCTPENASQDPAGHETRTTTRTPATH